MNLAILRGRLSSPPRHQQLTSGDHLVALELTESASTRDRRSPFRWRGSPARAFPRAGRPATSSWWSGGCDAGSSGPVVPPPAARRSWRRPCCPPAAAPRWPRRWRPRARRATETDRCRRPVAHGPSGVGHYGGMHTEQLEKVRTGRGFIAALDQSGGSTPKALKLYGVEEDAVRRRRRRCSTGSTRCAAASSPARASPATGSSARSCSR